MSPEPTETTRLMDRAAAGQPSAFDELARAVQDDLMRFALAQGLRTADAADAVQETLIRAYNGRKRWRKGRGVLRWLYGIAINVVREMRRKSSRHTAGLDANIVAAAAGQSEGGPVDGELIEQLSAALADLPPRQREAVACRFLRRMTVRRTAEAMGCAEGTVKAATAAAIENLRKSMKPPHRDTRYHD